MSLDVGTDKHLGMLVACWKTCLFTQVWVELWGRFSLRFAQLFRQKKQNIILIHKSDACSQSSHETINYEISAQGSVKEKD